MPDIKINNLSLKFNSKTIVFENADTIFHSNKLSLLIGPSGCGKSTLMRLIANVLKFDNSNYKISGSIKIGNNNVTQIIGAKIVSMMFQNPNQQFVMKTPREEIIFALENIQTPTNKIQEKLNFALKFCDISNLQNHEITTLSGGEKQKVILATMVAINPDVLLLDEPFASIDLKSKREILNKLIKIKKERNTTIIISDHDLSGYKEIVDDLFEIKSQKIKKIESDEMQLLLNNEQRTNFKFELPSDDSELLNLNNFALNVGNKKLLDIKSFSFYHGCTLLTGESGIGKSSLFKAITKIIKFHGQIKLEQQNINKIKNKKFYQNIALIFQNPTDQFLEITMAEEIKLAKTNSLSEFWDGPKIKQAVAKLGLNNKLDQVVYSLSGGQQKKLQILLMLIRDSPILLMDEPFTGLDVNSVKNIEELLQTTVIDRNHSLIIISHQIFQFNNFFKYHVNFSNQSLTYKDCLL